MTSRKLSVRTHVARDLLQSAALFKSDRVVVWEYVSNGLQYVEHGVVPSVAVEIDEVQKVITITDNGRGMDRSDLENFFVMHGENQDRRAGRAGRGRFGTGKAAAFGIANTLRVATVRNGQRNSVVLTRRDIESSGAADIPVRVIERDIQTPECNGTVITISDVKLKSLDVRGVIRYIERHLARWQGKPRVSVNDDVCEFNPPPISSTESISATTRGVSELGDATLVIHTSPIPLDKEVQGVSIYANGVLLETTLAGAEGRAFASHIFGSIDVPLLDVESDGIPIYDMSRSLQLNRENELVQALFGFIGREVDRTRRGLEKDDADRRRRDESKRLEKDASRIAALINEDFRDFTGRVQRVHAKAGAAKDLAQTNASENASNGDDFATGGDEPVAAVDLPLNEGQENGHGDNQGGPPHIEQPLLEASP